MKKILIVTAVLLALGLGAQAAMEARDFTCAVSGVSTGTATFTLRGEVQSVTVVSVPGGDSPSAVVTIATAEGTFFTKTVTATGTYSVRAPITTSATVAATITGGTNNVASPLYDKFALAGTVTATAANTTTNIGNYVFRVIYKP